MKRAVAFALMLSIVHAPAAIAGESLMEAAARAADRVLAAAPSPPASTAAAPASKDASRPAAARPAFQAGQSAPPAPMSGRSKLLLGLGIAAAVAGTMLAIDSRVEDNTPSTRGERINNPF
jgi:hypothetical protein